jgi:hypothetical protein
VSRTAIEIHWLQAQRDCGINIAIIKTVAIILAGRAYAGLGNLIQSVPALGPTKMVRTIKSINQKHHSP